MMTPILEDALDPDKIQEAIKRLDRLQRAVTHFQDLLPLIPRNLADDSSQR